MHAKPRRPGAPSRPAKELPPIGKLLRKLRGELLTIADAADRCGLSASSWHNKEIGLREVSIADLQAIAKGFGVSWKIDRDSITLG
jgi:transcriptional regulator with XRE-family HTH domain